MQSQYSKEGGTSLQYDIITPVDIKYVALLVDDFTTLEYLLEGT